MRASARNGARQAPRCRRPTPRTWGRLTDTSAGITQKTCLPPSPSSSLEEILLPILHITPQPRPTSKQNIPPPDPVRLIHKKSNTRVPRDRLGIVEALQGDGLALGRGGTCPITSWIASSVPAVDSGHGQTSISSYPAAILVNWGADWFGRACTHPGSTSNADLQAPRYVDLHELARAANPPRQPELLSEEAESRRRCDDVRGAVAMSPNGPLARAADGRPQTQDSPF